MSTVLKIERQQTALALVRIKLRLSYVEAITGQNNRFLRKIWKEVHGRSPSSGTSYTSVDTGLKTYSMARQSAAFARIYFATASEEHAKLAIHAQTFLAAWLTYVDLGINEDLTPDLAWQVIRNITAKNTTLHDCKKCGSRHIIFRRYSGQAAKCPFCYDAEKKARQNGEAGKKKATLHVVRERKISLPLGEGEVERRRPAPARCAEPAEEMVSSAYAKRA